MKRVHAELLGTSRKHAWFRFYDIFPHKILTMPRVVLPRGMATAWIVEVEVDEDSFRYNGVHYVADMKVIDVIRRRPSPSEEGALDSV